MKPFGGLLMLNEMLEQLPSSEAKVAQFILQNPEQFLELTAKELGEKTSTSAPAVVRLCKSIGLKGIQDLKLRITGDIANVHSPTEYRDIVKDEPFNQVVQKITMNAHRSIDETASLIVESNIEKSVQYIYQANFIFSFGIGASSLIAEDIKQKLQRINKNIDISSDLHYAVTELANAKENDVLIAISNSGETKEVIDIVRFAKQRNLKVISITQYGANTVSQLSDVPLYISAKFESAYRSGATASRLAQLFLIDILFMCMLAKNYDESIHYIDITREAIAQFKQIQRK